MLVCREVDCGEYAEECEIRLIHCCYRNPQHRNDFQTERGTVKLTTGKASSLTWPVTFTHSVRTVAMKMGATTRGAMATALRSRGNATY